MAEAVQRILEAMVPELEDLERLEIFSKSEIRSIVKKRTDFEYRLQSRRRSKVDYLRYIEYELHLDALRIRRRQRMGKKMTATASEYAAQSRVRRIFERAVRKYPADLKLWFQFIAYAAKSGSSKVVSRLFAQALQHHAHQPALWCKAARWELEQNNRAQGMRAFFQRALRLIPESKLLWLEFFRCEMQVINQIRERRRVLGISVEPDGENEDEEDEEDLFERLMNPTVERGIGNDEEERQRDAEFLAGALPRFIYSSAAAVPSLSDDLQFHLSFLHFVPLPPFGQLDHFGPLRQDIMDNIVETFPKVPEAWDARARYAAASETRHNPNDARAADTSAIAMYTSGTAQCASSTLWELFVGFLQERIQHASRARDRARVEFLVTHVLRAFDGAREAGVLSPLLVQAKARLLLQLGQADMALAAMREALDTSAPAALRKSLATWRLYLETLLKNGALVGRQGKFKLESMAHEYKRGIHSVSGEDSATLWRDLIDLYLSAARQTAGEAATRGVHKVFREAVAAVPIAEKHALKQLYLDWALCALLGEPTQVREVCRFVATQHRPIALEVFYKWIEVERVIGTPDDIRRIFELAVREFGRHSVALWIAYVAFENDQGQHDRARKVYWRAGKTLASTETKNALAEQLAMKQFAAAGE